MFFSFKKATGFYTDQTNTERNRGRRGFILHRRRVGGKESSSETATDSVDAVALPMLYVVVSRGGTEIQNKRVRGYFGCFTDVYQVSGE